jgi:molybdopterin synthase catalytic subunit
VSRVAVPAYTDQMPPDRLAVTADPLDVAALTACVLTEAPGEAGGVASFVGVVRGDNIGRHVSHLVYEAYEPLALKVFARIVDEASSSWPAARLGIHHRIGRLAIGEASVVIVAASAHRTEAFAACRYAIERLKQIAPIWKHEHFEGGEVWIEGATANPDDEAARAEAMRRSCA